MTEQHNPFAGIGNAQETGSGNYIKHGGTTEKPEPANHVLEVKKVKYLPPSQHQNKSFYIVEFEVVSSSVHKPGELVSWVNDLSKPKADGGDAVLAGVKNFVKAALDITETDMSADGGKAGDEFTLATTAVDQPCAGAQVACQSVPKESRKNKRVYTKNTFAAHKSA